MKETLEYIDAYFQNTLSPEEKKFFEKRCIEDNDFAQEVAFYVTSRQVIREELLQQKKEQWKGSNADYKKISSATIKKINFNAWLPYAAAASVLLAIVLYFFNGNNSPQQLAGTYINQNLMHISLTMDGSRDSMTQAIEAYNKKDYDKALNLFGTIYNDYPLNTDAKKYEGFVYLIKKDYNKALQEFDELANIKGLYSNPGLFLKALTLLQRNTEGDKEQARQLLKEVVQQNLEGSKEAEKWLKEF
jgi:hypothetical protein